MLGALIVAAGVFLGGYALASPSSRSDTKLASRHGPCPGRGRRMLSSTTLGASAMLVPPGAQQVLLCRYSGFGAYPKPVGSRSFRLIAHYLVVTRATVGSLASELNALKAVHGTQACPGDNGAVIIAFFRYGSHPRADDPVTIHLGGCSIVSNGHLNREAGLTLIRQLKTLTRSSNQRPEPYRLYTHCGIEWAKIHGTFWRAVKPLSDGHGNPPAGWGNPYQTGTLTFTSPTTAVFRSPPGSVSLDRTARTRPPFGCS